MSVHCSGSSVDLSMNQVNSHHIEEIPLQGSNDSEWPYSAPAPGNYMTRITTDPSQYALANVGHVSQHVPNPYAGPR